MTAQPSQAPVTLRDVARRLNVSHVTVSRALRDSPKVSAAVRQKIKRLAKEMGYRPNPMARGLTLWRNDRAKRTIHSELAWLNHWRNPGELRRFHTFDGYWGGAHATAEQHGFRLEEFVGNDPASLRATARVLRARNIDGILLVPGGPQDVPDQAWEDFPWEDFSVVRFGRRIGPPRCHIVTASQTFDCYKAFEKIAERGYKRIGLVTFPGNSGYLGGYLAAQTAVRSDPKLCFLASDPLNQNKFERWLRAAKPDAILTDAIKIPQMLARAGYRVPQDIGLAALNVSDIDADAGIYQFPEETGQIAVETLISLIHHNHRGIPKVPREVLVCGEWRDGKSLPVAN